MSKLRLVKLKGGLGNQMFEYAFIKALSLINNICFVGAMRTILGTKSERTEIR